MSSSNSSSIMTEAIIDISSGTVAGVVSRFFSHPIDTVKARLQISSSSGSSSNTKNTSSSKSMSSSSAMKSSMQKQCYSGAMDCFFKVLKNEGFRALYSGVTYPVVGAGFENAAVFFLYGQTSSFLLKNETSRKFFDLPELSPEKKKREKENKPLGVVALAGLVGGVGAGTVLTPSELLKTRAQVDPKKYPDVISALKRTLKEEKGGAIRSLFVGWNSMVVREGFGASVYFFVYEFLLRQLFMMKKNPETGKREIVKKRNQVPILGNCFAGGLGGVASWTMLYPVEAIRARIQAPNSVLKENQITNSFFSAGKQLYKEGGVKIFFRGWGPAAARAFSSNAIVFGMYESVSERVEKIFHD